MGKYRGSYSGSGMHSQSIGQGFRSQRPNRGQPKFQIGFIWPSTGRPCRIDGTTAVQAITRFKMKMRKVKLDNGVLTGLPNKEEVFVTAKMTCLGVVMTHDGIKAALVEMLSRPEKLKASLELKLKKLDADLAAMKPHVGT